jgi:hypothetical protein
MANKKLVEKKMETSSSTNVPTYLRSDLFLGLFCGAIIIDSTNVPHDTHVLGVKHHFFLIHLKWIH